MERFRLKQGYKIMMEAEAGMAEAEIMLLSPAAEAKIIELVPLLKARIFPRAQSLVLYKNIMLYLEFSSDSLYGSTGTPSRRSWENTSPHHRAKRERTVMILEFCKSLIGFASN